MANNINRFEEKERLRRNSSAQAKKVNSKSNLYADIIGAESNNHTYESKEITKEIDIEFIDLDEQNEFLFGYEDLDKIVNSIKENGFKGSIKVYKKDDGRYLCFDGSTRVQAFKLLERKRIPATIYKMPDNQDDIRMEEIVFNTYRTISPLHRARTIKEFERILRKKNCEDINAEIEKQFGIKKSAIYSYKKILELPQQLQELCKLQNCPYTLLVSFSDRLSPDNLDTFSENLYNLLQNNERVTNSDLEKILAGCSLVEKAPLPETLVENIPSKSDKKPVTTFKKFEKNLSEINIPEDFKVTSKNKEKTLESVIQMKEKLNSLIQYLDKIEQNCR